MRELLSHARSILWMCPLIGVATVFMGTVSMFSSIFDATGKLQHKVAVAWAKMLLKICLVRVEVVGAHRLKPDQAYVFCSNHFSLIDTPLMFVSMPRPFRILARHRLWRIPFLGWHLGRAGHLPVNRENPRTFRKPPTRSGPVRRSCYSPKAADDTATACVRLNLVPLISPFAQACPSCPSPSLAPAKYYRAARHTCARVEPSCELETLFRPPS
jgi:1-acyl-sn-glycerol-3-phosphate acyltransferase